MKAKSKKVVDHRSNDAKYIWALVNKETGIINGVQFSRRNAYHCKTSEQKVVAFVPKD